MRRQNEWNEKTAIAAVKAFAAEKGYQPVGAEASSRNGLPSTGVATRLFGSWNGLIKAAGFKPYPAENSYLARAMAVRDRSKNWETEPKSKLRRSVLRDVRQ